MWIVKTCIEMLVNPPTDLMNVSQNIKSNAVKATTGVKWTDLVLLSFILITMLPTDISMLTLYIA